MNLPSVFNPYRDYCDLHDRTDASSVRKGTGYWPIDEIEAKGRLAVLFGTIRHSLRLEMVVAAA
jgi:hypothetical protein